MIPTTTRDRIRVATIACGIVILATLFLATLGAVIDSMGEWNAQRSSAPNHAVRAERSLTPTTAPPSTPPVPPEAEAVNAAVHYHDEQDRMAAEAAAADALAQAEADRRATVRSPTPSVGASAPSVGSCAGDVECFLACTIDHESRSAGVYTAVSPGGTYRGAYQFDASTWRGAVTRAGYPEYADTPADQVPGNVQDAAAAQLYSERGNQPWGGRC